MTRAPDPGFPRYSPASRKLVDTSNGSLLDELRAELARRRSFYPSLVRKGDMTEAEMHAGTAPLVEIVAEFEHGHRAPRHSWADKLNLLRREIMIRRNSLPRRIAAGDITQEDADRRLGALEAAQEYYWLYGMQHGSEFLVPGDLPATYGNFRSERDRREAWARAQGFGPSVLYAEGADIIYPAGWTADHWPDTPAASAAAA